MDPAVHAEVYGEEPPPGAGTDTGTSTATDTGTGGTTSPTPAPRPADDRGHGTAVLTPIADVMGSALPSVATVILVAGAGGVFGKVLVASGIGDAIADVLDRTDLRALFLAFLMALTLRAAQGSTTVARAALGPVVRLSAR
jgi:hypothetical protein